jgi:hypothetical protein
MSRLYRNRHLDSLSGFPMHRKILHLALWEQADEIGFAKLRMDVLSDLCGQYTFTHEDVDALAPHVHRMSHKEVFLPDFLKTQQRTLSRTSHGANKVWRELNAKFGATRQNPEPYFAFMRSLKMDSHIPEMPEDYLGGDNPKPPWLLKHLANIEQASKYPEPEWPENILQAYRSMVDNYFQKAKDVTSKSQAESHRVTTRQIDNSQRQIQTIINLGYDPLVVENCIRAAIDKTRLTVYPPPFKP